MAEGTPLSCLEDECRRNRSEITALQKEQIEMGSSVRNIEKMLQDTLKMKQPFKESLIQSSSFSNFTEIFGDSHTGRWPKGMKTELPMFDGEDVEEWTFRAREYFEAYAVPEDMRVRLLSFHMIGPTYTWYR
ncbi:hypothetical protein PIB30_052296 [Stylosanthes scabra]|uniref:Uncharacterized protein n=1 Tax=Stylosanthes scabra TaxID=79078 RepID=A0ABU6RIV2_9FABA|nr:hypothetical protein [Stylosanthes scabra]